MTAAFFYLILLFEYATKLLHFCITQSKATPYHEIGLNKLENGNLCVFLHTHFSKTAKDQPNLSLLIYAVYEIVAKWEL